MTSTFLTSKNCNQKSLKSSTTCDCRWIFERSGSASSADQTVQILATTQNTNSEVRHHHRNLYFWVNFVSVFSLFLLLIILFFFLVLLASKYGFFGVPGNKFLIFCLLLFINFCFLLVCRERVNVGSGFDYIFWVGFLLLFFEFFFWDICVGI